MTPSPALDRASTGDRVREVLLSRILDGSYAPGDRIVESRVARELDTSQAPVREALRELQGLGLVTVKPYRGACVRQVDEDEMLEAAEVRAILEGSAALRAGGRLADHGDELTRELDGMRSAAAAGDVDGFARHDLAFHRVVVEAAEHGILLRTWESLGVGVRIRMLLERTGARLHAVAEAHAPVAEACVGADGDEVARLLRLHPRTVYERAGLAWPR